MKTFFVVLAGIFAFLYLLNPAAGFLEFIPDNLPVIGNLDEAGATALLIASLGYFGIDFAHIFKRAESDTKKENIKDAEFEDVEK